MLQRFWKHKDYVPVTPAASLTALALQSAAVIERRTLKVEDMEVNQGVGSDRCISEIWVLCSSMYVFCVNEPQMLWGICKQKEKGGLPEQVCNLRKKSKVDLT